MAYKRVLPTTDLAAARSTGEQIAASASRPTALEGGDVMTAAAAPTSC